MPPEESKHYCLKEQDWGRLWEIVKRHTAHVVEGDGDGGFRDRLLVTEKSVEAMNKKIDEMQQSFEKKIDELRKAMWKMAVVGGIIGALIGSGSKDILVILIKWIMGC